MSRAISDAETEEPTISTLCQPTSQHKTKMNLTGLPSHLARIPLRVPVRVRVVRTIMLSHFRLAPIDETGDVGDVRRRPGARREEHRIECLRPPFFENSVGLAQPLKAAKGEHPCVALLVLLDSRHARGIRSYWWCGWRRLRGAVVVRVEAVV